MQDRELYRRILGVEAPWEVERVELRLEKGEVHIYKIQWVKYTARGFRNKQNFINAIYFHCGGLDLAPGSH